MARGEVAERVLEDVGRASWIRAMFEKGRALRARVGAERVCDFSLGNPDQVPPQAFFDSIEAVAQERAPALHRYMPNAGLDETRAAIAGFLSREYRVEIDAAGLLVTCGAAGGLNVVLRAICDPDDEVIILAPYFPEYRFYIQQAGARMLTVDTDEHCQPVLQRIRDAITPRTRAILVNSPNNPSGAVYGEEFCSQVAELLREFDRADRPLYLLTDDPYRRLIYDRDWCPTPVRHYARSVIISSYSKDMSIAGERIGYVALPRALPGREVVMSAVTMLNRTLGFVNAPAFMQRVVARCADALCDVSAYKRKREMLCDVLRGAGYEFAVPGGGMFVFPKTPIADDALFVDKLLEQYILAVPGRGFGRAGYMRLSFAVEPDVIERSAAGFRAAREAAQS